MTPNDYLGNGRAQVGRERDPLDPKAIFGDPPADAAHGYYSVPNHLLARGIDRLMSEATGSPTVAPSDFRYENDPRFKFKITNRDGNLWKYIDPNGDSAEIDPRTAKPWVDLDHRTQFNDLSSIVNGKGGTSVGDAWAASDIAIVKKLAVQNGGKVDQRLIDMYVRHLLETKDPHFMSQHPGKAAFEWDK